MSPEPPATPRSRPAHGRAKGRVIGPFGIRRASNGDQRSSSLDGDGLECFHLGMATEQTYKGSCHCGKVNYEVKAELEQVYACNCSICTKKGHLLTFVTPEKFSLLSGDAGLTDYQFHKKNIHHLFCPTCGIQSFMRGKKPDGSATVAINVRCLEGVDPGGLKVKQVDGRSF